MVALGVQAAACTVVAVIALSGCGMTTGCYVKWVGGEIPKYMTYEPVRYYPICRGVTPNYGSVPYCAPKKDGPFEPCDVRFR